MKYLSVCSGIEAATVAWHDLGWTPVAFSEIEPFPSAVLKHHHPDVPNVGDMTKFKEWNLETIDLLVGGTPCQSFSVAGLRKGLDDPRGNLMLTFLAIAERERPQWIVWENVPGVLSSNGGRDFGTFLGALGELGYGWAYRVLDAQWFGVAQRRRRVFVVGCLGDQAGAAAVLFESESVQRNPAPSREARQGAARGVASGTYLGNAEGGAAGVPYLTCSNINAHINNQTPLVGESVAQPVAYGIDGEQNASEELIGTLRSHQSGGYEGARVAQPVAIPIHDQATRFAGKRGDKQDGKGNGFGVGNPGDPCPTLTKGDKHAVAQPVATFAKTHKPMSSTDAEGWSPVDAAPTVTHWPRDRSDAGTDVAVVQAVGTDCYNGAITGEVAATIGTPGSSVNASGPTVMTAMQVRRLTPVECERLQGFPDGYTNIPWRKKPEAPDGPRYKALGNSMAVPCMKWIGERIQAATARQEASK